MTSRKQDILVKAKSAGLFGVARRRSAPAIRILCYHGLWLTEDGFGGDSMFMRAKTFRRRLEIIRREGYPVIPLADAVQALRGTGPALPPAAVVITIDDGWWSTYTDMLPHLTAHGMPATLYCDTAQLQGKTPIAHVMARYLEQVPQPAGAKQRDAATIAEARHNARDLKRPMTERLQATRQLARALGIDLQPYLDGRAFDYMTPDELAAAAREGLDVQLHTHRHTLGDMSAPLIATEIADNRRALSDILNRPPAAFTEFCYPSGVATPAAAETLAGLGLGSSTTTRQGLAWPGMPMHLLPRLLDGENLSEIEFEAELSGFGDWLRAGRHTVERVLGRVPINAKTEARTQA
jgi:peptidoglycan/xylan/chitin deacetylase (PgdA/CDA1 family)